MISLFQLFVSSPDVINVFDGEEKVDGTQEEQEEVDPEVVVPTPYELRSAWVTSEEEPQVD